MGKVFEEKEQLDETEHNHNQMKFSSMMAGEKSRMTSSKSQLNDACDSNKKLRVDHTSSPFTKQQRESYDPDGSPDIREYNEDHEVNEDIIHNFPKKLFSKVLAIFSQEFDLFRSNVLRKLANGIIISRKPKILKGINALGSNFNPVGYFEQEQNKRKRASLESFGYHKRLIKFDFEHSRLLFYSNKTKTKALILGRKVSQALSRSKRS